MQKILNYINGSLVEPISNTFFDNINPSTGEAYSLIPDSDERDVDAAVQAAQGAFQEWSNTPAAKRSAVLLKIASLIDRDLEKLSLAESVDNGKPVGLAKS